MLKISKINISFGRWLFVGAGALVLCLLVLTGNVSAATIQVTAGASDTDENGNCSLYEAVQAARTAAAVDACIAGTGDDTISLPDGIYDLSEAGIDLDLGHASIILDGESRSGTVIDGAGSLGLTYGGGSGAIAITLSNLTVRNTTGLAPNDTTEVDLTITDTLWHDNTVSGSDAIIEVSSNSPSTFILTESVIRNNTGYIIRHTSWPLVGAATLSNLEIYENEQAAGNTAHLIFTRTSGSITASEIEFYDNEGGLQLYSGTIDLHNMNYYGNQDGVFLTPDEFATVSNLAIFDNQGMSPLAIANDGNYFELDLSNSTIANNTSIYPALFLMSDGDEPLSGRIANVTIANHNRTGDLGGMEIAAAMMVLSQMGTLPTVEVTNTIFANNLDEGVPRNCVPPNPGMMMFAWESAGNNLISDNTCASLMDHPSDIHSTNPQLGSLTAESGTWVMPLFAGSPAINAGATVAAITHDQRGVSRPQGSAYDIGAYEVLGSNDENDDESEAPDNTPPSTGNDTGNDPSSTNKGPKELAQTGLNIVISTLVGALIISGVLFIARRRYRIYRWQ